MQWIKDETFVFIPRLKLMSPLSHSLFLSLKDQLKIHSKTLDKFKP